MPPWPPPRTLLKAAALPGVLASLSAPDRYSIYQGRWNEVQAPPPTDNTSAGGRGPRMPKPLLL
ncbi:hypothetical protein [Hymenobacter terricola]|uniref:hypothetical protein n=1 Tax=Hymenobacter terricola TaxID=2819236 RepID=UPI001B30F44D|nr:hypothetical protein [Hymenobacter terricola]